MTVALVVGDSPSASQLAAMGLLGVSMLVAQSLFIAALRRADAAAVAPFLSLVPLFAAVYDWLLYGERPTAASSVGVAVIIWGAGWLARREQALAE